MGMPSFVYRWFFLAHSLRSFERNILKFCGFGPVRSTVLGGVASGDSSKRLRWLDEMRALGRSGR
jgi:putative NADPH-quinone reductase